MGEKTLEVSIDKFVELCKIDARMETLKALTAEQKKEQWEKKKKKAVREPKYQNEIARIAAEARKLGMSYGEYVATGGRRNNG